MRKYILEIKNRVLLIFLSYIFSLLTSYYYKEILLFQIIKPKKGLLEIKSFNLCYFIFTDVTEIFYVYFNLILFISFQIFIMLTLYNMFLFFSSALYKKEFYNFKLLLKSIIFVYVLSIFLANYVLIPLSWNFFLSFQDVFANKSFNIHFEAKLIEYFNFFISLYYLCIIYFQLFLVLFVILEYLNSNYKTLKKFRKVFYFFFVVFATLFCPELLSQILFSILLFLVYEFFLFKYIFNKFY